MHEAEPDVVGLGDGLGRVGEAEVQPTRGVVQEGELVVRPASCGRGVARLDLDLAVDLLRRNVDALFTVATAYARSVG